ATTRSRPIINTRDEPHADAERFRRLHVIVGDSNMSEYTNYLKMGTASIVLRMLEEDKGVWRDLTLENPIRAIREISHDITCKRRVRLANGRELSAFEIQSEYLTRAQKFAARKGLAERICTDADILDATSNPPQSTRAKLRGAFIKRAKERKRDYTVDWVHLKLNDQAQRTVLCKDPFKSEDERVEKLIACL